MMKSVFQTLVKQTATRPDVVTFEDDSAAITWADLSTRIANLALTPSGRRQVPLPFFFSAGQIAHIIANAGVGAVITKDISYADLPQIQPIASAQPGPAHPLRNDTGGTTRVIYTSGSSEQPKCVIIGDRQLAASLSCLGRVFGFRPPKRCLTGR